MDDIRASLAIMARERSAAEHTLQESEDLEVTVREDHATDSDSSSDDAWLAQETSILASSGGGATSTATTTTTTTTTTDWGRDKSAHAEIVRELLWNWHRIRREDYGVSTIDDEHGCSKACASTESIQCISDAHHLWGCLNSGQHHICHADAQCEQRYTTREGYTWCTFSRAMLSRTSDDTRYGVLLQASDEFVPRPGADLENRRMRRREKRLMDMSNTVYNAPAPKDQTARKLDSSANGGDGLHAPWSVGILADTPEGTPPPPSLSPPHKRMRFDMEVLGGPTRDMKAVREVEGGADSVALTGDCGNTAADDDEGFVDVDGDDEVDRIPTLGAISDTAATAARAKPRPRPSLTIQSAENGDLTVVAATTQATSSADTSDTLAITVPEPSRAVSRLRTRSSGRLAAAPSVLRDHFTRDTQLDIGRILDALFNMRYREGVVLNMRTASETLVLDVLRKYFRQCKTAGVRPHSHVVDAVYTAAMKRNPRLTLAPDAELDGLRRKRYVAYIYELWRVAISTPYFERAHNKFRLINHVAGALYMLQEPFAIILNDGVTLVTVIERDEFLSKHLPAQNLLREWSAPMRVASASRVLAIKGVANGRARFSKTCVSSGRNAIKDALLSLETDRERNDAAERIRTAYAHGTYHDDNVVYQVHD